MLHLSFFLNNGNTFAKFQDSGNIFQSSDMFISLVSDSAIDGTASFNILGLMPSAPVAYVVSLYFEDVTIYLSLNRDGDVANLCR